MTTSKPRKTSKFLSLILRHQPELIDLHLDEYGWAELDDLIDKVNAKNGMSVSRVEIEQIVATSDKQRFQLSEDGNRIRANQGHSIKVNLELFPVDPPAVLYHGTATRFLESILEHGLTKRQRHHVHLSSERATAEAVGTRHGKLAMLVVDAAAMYGDGHEFFVSANGVWLTGAVPAKYLTRQ
ncbi:UNVERIFIED_CONTAM: hypothetical protein GTU68_033887 [Idotea baltica]|nr:hypothetical protein [Idotea baltica]